MKREKFYHWHTVGIIFVLALLSIGCCIVFALFSGEPETRQQAIPIIENTATAIPTIVPTPTQVQPTKSTCSAAYPDFCIPNPPPDLDCGDIPQKEFIVLQPDPHELDRDKNGIGCEIVEQ